MGQGGRVTVSTVENSHDLLLQVDYIFLHLLPLRLQLFLVEVGSFIFDRGNAPSGTSGSLPRCSE